MQDRTQEFLSFCEEKQLTIKQVMEMTGAAYNTVILWRCATNDRHIPAAKFELLRLRVAASEQ